MRILALSLFIYLLSPPELVVGKERLKAKPRLCSLTLASDEILYELLSIANSLEQLVCVSSIADSEVASNVFGKIDKGVLRADKDLESVALAKPDIVVIASYNRPAIRESLQRLGITVLMLEDVAAFADIKINITKLGEASGQLAAAKALIANMDSRLANVALHKSNAKLLGYGYGGNVYGVGSTFDAIVTAAGAVNLSSDLVKGWGKLSLEVLARLQADHIVIAGDPDPSFKETLQQKPGWQSIEAVKQGKLIFVPGKYLGSVSHHAVRAVELLERELAVVKASP